MALSGGDSCNPFRFLYGISCSHELEGQRAVTGANKQAHLRRPQDEPSWQSSIEPLCGCQTAALRLLK